MKTRFGATSGPLASDSCTLSGSAFLPTVKYVETGTGVSCILEH